MIEGRVIIYKRFPVNGDNVETDERVNVSGMAIRPDNMDPTLCQIIIHTRSTEYGSENPAYTIHLTDSPDEIITMAQLIINHAKRQKARPDYKQRMESKA